MEFQYGVAWSVTENRSEVIGWIRRVRDFRHVDRGCD